VYIEKAGEGDFDGVPLFWKGMMSVAIARINLSVREMLKIPNCSKLRVIAGESGMDNIVKTVSVMDAPDIHRWLKGGEFLITSGYPLRGNVDLLEKLIINIHRRGAAAFGIKLGRFVDEIPQSVAELADRLRLPILKIPMEFAFTDIINPVLMDIIDTQSRRLLFSERIHDEFTRLVIEGKQIEQILETLSGIIGMRVCYVDAYFGQVYISGENGPRPLDEYKWRDLMAQGRSHPVRIDSRTYGHIAILEKLEDSQHGQYEETAINHAATVIKLCIQKKISTMQVEERYRDEFVQDLVLDNIKSQGEIESRAALYGWEHGGRAFAVVADIDDFKSGYTDYSSENKQLEERANGILFEMRKRYKQHYGRNLMYKTFSDNIVFIISQKDDGEIAGYYEGIEGVASAIALDVARMHGYSITTGVGEIKDLKRLSESFKEAKRAVQLGRKVCGKSGVAFYRSLGAYILIEQACKSEYTQEFFGRYIEPLLKYDRKNGTEFMKTLSAIMECDWNLKVASQQMYIHYNTMKYRFERIAAICGVDLARSEERFNMSLAFKVMEISDGCI